MHNSHRAARIKYHIKISFRVDAQFHAKRARILRNRRVPSLENLILPKKNATLIELKPQHTGKLFILLFFKNKVLDKTKHHTKFEFLIAVTGIILIF